MFLLEVVQKREEVKLLPVLFPSSKFITVWD